VRYNNYLFNTKNNIDMNLLESLQWRYATKKMNGEKIPQDKLDRILQATKLAPSSYGLTPYNVIVVEDQKLKEELQGAAYGQTQLSESSAVLVFATWDDVTEDSVDIYINEIARQREMSVEGLKGMSDMIKGSLSNMTQEQKISWAQRQAYIGLGFALVAAATEEVDSTPMEGFNPPAVDSILGLKEQGLMSVAILPLGYRDGENDYLVNAKKVRWDDNKFFIRK
jgi:nitroreductase/dihydropteridine reductase